jgi:hypothetical protein
MAVFSCRMQSVCEGKSVQCAKHVPIGSFVYTISSGRRLGICDMILALVTLCVTLLLPSFGVLIGGSFWPFVSPGYLVPGSIVCPLLF